MSFGLGESAAHLVNYSVYFILCTTWCNISAGVSDINSSPSEQNGRHFPDNIFICIFLHENFVFYNTKSTWNGTLHFKLSKHLYPQIIFLKTKKNWHVKGIDSMVTFEFERKSCDLLNCCKNHAIWNFKFATWQFSFTHWGWVMHICVSRLDRHWFR